MLFASTSFYLDYLSVFLCKDPQDVSWQALRDFIRWLQKARSLSDRTMNAVISQLRFFTIYVLHKTWDDSQLPRRRFDEYLPYVPSQKDTWTFISTIPDLKVKAFVTLLYSAGLRSCEVRHYVECFKMVSDSKSAYFSRYSLKITHHFIPLRSEFPICGSDTYLRFTLNREIPGKT